MPFLAKALSFPLECRVIGILGRGDGPSGNGRANARGQAAVAYDAVCPGFEGKWRGFAVYINGLAFLTPAREAPKACDGVGGS